MQCKLHYVLLYSPDRFNLEDSVTYTNQIGDISFGRIYDGAPQWIYFYKTTPNASNVLRVIPTPEKFNLYPVPAAHELNISLGELTAQKVKISISDMLGKVLLSNEINYAPGDIITTNVAELAMGFYCIQISGEGINQRVLFTKQ